jgi:hypothetical protein
MKCTDVTKEAAEPIDYEISKLNLAEGTSLPETREAELRCGNYTYTVKSTKAPFWKRKSALQCMVVEPEMECNKECGVEKVPPSSFRRVKKTE